MVNPDEQSKEVEGSLATPIELDGFERIRANMRGFGEQYGRERSVMDINGLATHILLGTELQEQAIQDFSRRIFPANIGTFSLQEARDIYVEAYCTAYKAGVAPIEDEITRKIWMLAIQNRRAAKLQEPVPDLANKEERWRSDISDIQATLQIAQMLGQGDVQDIAYLEEIRKLKVVYYTLSERIQAVERKGGDAVPPPGPFPHPSYEY